MRVGWLKHGVGDWTVRHFRLKDLQDELKHKGIPELARRLKRETGYSARRRKMRRNPDEAKSLYDAKP